MALATVPSAHLLSTSSIARSSIFRKDGCDEMMDAYCQSQRRTSVRFSILSEGFKENRGKRGARVRTLAVFNASTVSTYRFIGQVNEAIRNANSVPEALKLLEDTKAGGVLSPNEATYASLMLACRKHRQGERALTVYEALKQLREPINVRTYNTLLSCCQQALRVDDAYRVKAEMEAAGVMPDFYTYTSLIDAVVRNTRMPRALRFQKAMSLYKEMVAREIIPDLRTYNSLISIAGDLKASEKALDLYYALVKSGSRPSPLTFETLLKCLGSGGRLKAAEQVYNEARAAGVPLMKSTYNLLIESCASAPQPDTIKAWKFYEGMIANGVTPNAETFISLIKTCSKAGDNTGVMKAFQTMKESGMIRSVTSVAYDQIIESASIANTLDDALKIYEELKSAGLKPNARTYGSLMAACIRNKDFNKAEAIEKEEFQDIDVSSNQTVLHSLIRAYGEADKWEDSLRIFEDMLKQGGMSATDESFAAVFDACVGKEQRAAFKASDKPKIQITPRIQAGIDLYQKHAKRLNNYSISNLSRCDVTKMSEMGAFFAILSWLKAVRANPPTSDVIIVTGSTQEVDNSRGRPRYPARHSLAIKTARGMALPSMRLDTLSMLAITTTQSFLKKWLDRPDPFLTSETTEVTEEDGAATTAATEGNAEEDGTAATAATKGNAEEDGAAATGAAKRNAEEDGAAATAATEGIAEEDGAAATTEVIVATKLNPEEDGAAATTEVIVATKINAEEDGAATATGDSSEKETPETSGAVAASE